MHPGKVFHSHAQKGSLMIIRFLPSCKESPDGVSAASDDYLQKLYNSYAVDAVHFCKCPLCDADSLHDWGYYTRRMIYSCGQIENGFRLKVKRLRCSQCGHTHAVMPWWIIPYCRFSVLVVYLFLTENINSESLISFDLNVIIRFRKLYKLVWRDRLIRIGIAGRTKLRDICYRSLSVFRMNFMQSRCGTAFPT